MAALFYMERYLVAVYNFIKKEKSPEKQKHTTKSAEALLLGISLFYVLWVRMQVYTLGQEKRKFSCQPTSISMAEHIIAVQMKPANEVTASLILVCSCLLPTLAGWGNGLEKSLSWNIFQQKGKKKCFFLAAPVLSSDPSTTTHTFMPTQHRGQSKKQAVRAATVYASSTSKKLLVKQSSISGLWCCHHPQGQCAGHCKGLLHSECLGHLWMVWISLWQCLTHHWLQKQFRWLLA